MMGCRWSAAFGRRALLSVLAALLPGCAVGPDFKEPEPPPPGAYSTELQPAETVTTPLPGGEAQRFVQDLDIPGQWWTLFRSPPLNALIDEALAANPTLQAAQASLRQAQALLMAGEGALFPTVNANVSTVRQKIAGASFGVPQLSPVFNLNTASVSVSYLLDIWGGTRRQVETLAAQAENERFLLEASYLTLTSNLVAAAVTEAALRGQIAATQEIIFIQRQELEHLRRQFTIGAAANAAVLAQAAALAQTEAQLPGLEKQLAQTRHLLTALLGRFPSDPPAQSFDLESLHLPQTLPATLPSRLVEQRPDIRAAEAQLHAATAEIGVATANMLPQLTLSASYGSETSGALFGPGTSVWNLGAALAQPIFQGGTLLYRRQAAVAASEAAAAQYRQSVIAAFQNVADVLRALQSDAEALQAQEAAERAAADSLAVSRRQFHAGAISYLALLSAEQTYQQARITLVQAQAARYSDTAALFQALGGGWWNRSDGPPPTFTVDP